MNEDYITVKYKTISAAQKYELTSLMQSTILNGFTQKDFDDVCGILRHVVDRPEKQETEN